MQSGLGSKIQPYPAASTLKAWSMSYQTDPLFTMYVTPRTPGSNSAAMVSL